MAKQNKHNNRMKKKKNYCRLDDKQLKEAEGEWEKGEGGAHDLVVGKEHGRWKHS